MFTGIVEGIGEVVLIDQNLYTIRHPFGNSFAVGESIALSGVCTTVLTSDSSHFTVEIIEESRNVTIFDQVKVGDKVNLERSAIIGQRNSGHTVQGHVDETGEVLGIEQQGDYYVVRIGISKENSALIVYKGSIALNGVSLTLSGVGKDWFEVSVIAHTWKETTISDFVVGIAVNVEYDVMGKHILRSLQKNREE